MDKVERQKKNLVNVINEAKASEAWRMDRLSRATTPGDKDALLRRFEKERAVDQTKIQNLTADFFAIREKAEKGQLRSVSPSRSQSSVPSEGQNRNRFFGFDDVTDVNFHIAVCKKFNKFDARFNNKINRPSFNVIEEHKQLRLLNEKRDLLKQLVSIHAAERVELGYKTDRSCSTPATDRSFYHSSASVASYATFANTATNSCYNNKPVKHVIPRLNLNP